MKKIFEALLEVIASENVVKDLLLLLLHYE